MAPWIARYGLRHTATDPLFLSTYRKCAPSLDVGGLTLPLIFDSVLAVHLYQVCKFVLPSWLDSCPHMPVARTIRDSGRVPKSYAPYSDL